MKLKHIRFLFFVTSITYSCTTFVLPEKCVDPLPTSITINRNGKNIVASAGSGIVTWELLNNAKQSIATSSSQQFTALTTTYPKGNYTLKANGKNSCGFIFNLETSLTVCDSPTTITLTTTNEIISCAINMYGNKTNNGVGLSWELINKVTLKVEVSESKTDLNSNDIFSFNSTKILNGEYIIKVSKINDCNNSPFILELPYTITNGMIPSTAIFKAFTAGGVNDDSGFYIITDSNGDVYVAGQNGGNASFDGIIYTQAGFFVAKYGNDGKLIKYVTDNTFQRFQRQVSGIALDGLGNICLSFHDFLNNSNRTYGYVKYKRTDLSYAGAFIESDVNGYKFETKGLGVDKLNNTFLLATASFPDPNSATPKDSWVVIARVSSSNKKTDPGYAFYGLSSNGALSSAHDIVVYDEDNIYITGHSKGTINWITSPSLTTTSTKYKTFIAKFNGTLFPQWIRTENNTSSGYQAESIDGNKQPVNWAHSTITTDNAGNVYMAGVFQGANITFGSQTLLNQNTGYYENRDHYLVKYSSSGNFQWLKPTNNKVASYGIGKDTNGNILLTGSTTNAASTAERIYIQKYDANGNILIDKYPIESGGLSAGGGIVEDINGNIWVSGKINNLGGSTHNLIGGQVLIPKSDDILIIKYSPK